MSKSRRIKKFEKLAYEALSNGIRLHFDSILLYKNKSYPSAFHFAVLSLEEIAKSNWIDHYIDVTTTNNGLPSPDGEEEQEWVKLLYIHTRKQNAFVHFEYDALSPAFSKFVMNAKLEYKKQKSIYVGLQRNKKGINTKSRISLPSQIKLTDARQIISLNNEVLINQCKRNKEHGFYYGTYEKYLVLDELMQHGLQNIWKHRSGLIGKKWNTLAFKKARSKA